ncbi:hypothetical protein MVEN_02596000 [Mycena venus]|uniref:Uncharacterized protein n=1 Tax=Mycena venus TaxID=2733690 RepID=A0A8H6U3B8_9AGAR|nr:hypothetical protein MVEN_02596000 [Mycena venus]
MDDDREMPRTPGAPTDLSSLDILGRTCSAAFINSAGGISIRDCTTNVTFMAQATPPDFRVFSLGDIDLQHEICVDYDTGIVDLQPKRACVRRVYSARVEGKKSRVTVATYHGGGAEQILDRHRQSPILTVISMRAIADFRAAFRYFHSEFHQYLKALVCTLWIRRSTGRLCAELIAPMDINSVFLSSLLDGIPGAQEISFSSVSNTEAMVIETLPLEVYHDICAYNMTHLRDISISTHVPVKPGSVIRCSSSSQPEDCIEIASMPVSFYIGFRTNSNKSAGDKMADGWTGFRSSDVLNTRIEISVSRKNIYDCMHPHPSALPLYPFARSYHTYTLTHALVLASSLSHPLFPLFHFVPSLILPILSF